nr:SDR family oxidoreductase [Mesorhizobium sp.]
MSRPNKPARQGKGSICLDRTCHRDEPCWRCRHGTSRISVTAMAPGVVNTILFSDRKTPEQIAGFAARTSHKRLGEPSDIADAIAALCSGDGAWIDGQTVFANGGIV